MLGDRFDTHHIQTCKKPATTRRFLVGDTFRRHFDRKMRIHAFQIILVESQFTDVVVADIVSKYGLVPKDVMPETNSSENTSRMAGLIALKLREQGLQLRDLAAQGVDNTL